MKYLIATIVILVCSIVFKWAFKKAGIIKPPKIKFQKDTSVTCPKCGQEMYIQLDRKKEFVDDWDSDLLVCFNKECAIYGRPTIRMWHPDTGRPFGEEPKEENPICYKVGDQNLKIINN